VRGKFADLVRAGHANDVEPDGHLFEVGRRVIDVVLLSVAKRGAHVRGRIFDRDFVEGREPRQLREQSKGGADHEVLEGRRALLCAASGERFVGLNRELAHAAFEVDVLNDSRHGAGRGGPLRGRLSAHLRAQSLDLFHLSV
jgi:hypothetical protein